MNCIANCADCGRILYRKRRGYYKCCYCKGTVKYFSSWLKIKKKFLENNPYCEICADTDRLHVHHKDGNSFNNNWENLAVRCIQCHLSLHRTNNRKIDRIKYGQFGKRLIYA